MFLSRPYPIHNFSWRTVGIAFISGRSVTLILYILKPFGIDHTHTLLLNTIYYGLGTFVLITLNAYLMPLFFPFFFKEEAWTTGKEALFMLWYILTIAVYNLVLTHFLYNDVPLSLSTMLNFLWITLVIGVFPVTLVILFKQQALLRKYSLGARELEEQLHHEPEVMEEKQPALVQFTGDNQNERLTVPLQDIRFISSADNYIKVHFIREGNLTVYVLRSTLKKAEACVQDHPQLFRCHRTFIVNLAAVDQVSGNAQGYKLHLKDTDELIPVSRSLNNELTEHIQKYSSPSH